nr:hypothetical protein CFP56_70592 [Quercus suber]
MCDALWLATHQWEDNACRYAPDGTTRLAAKIPRALYPYEVHGRIIVQYQSWTSGQSCSKSIPIHTVSVLDTLITYLIDRNSKEDDHTMIPSFTKRPRQSWPSEDVSRRAWALLADCFGNTKKQRFCPDVLLSCKPDFVALCQQVPFAIMYYTTTIRRDRQRWAHLLSDGLRSLQLDSDQFHASDVEQKERRRFRTVKFTEKQGEDDHTMIPSFTKRPRQSWPSEDVSRRAWALLADCFGNTKKQRFCPDVLLSCKPDFVALCQQVPFAIMYYTTTIRRDRQRWAHLLSDGLRSLQLDSDQFHASDVEQKERRRFRTVKFTEKQGEGRCSPRQRRKSRSSLVSLVQILYHWSGCEHRGRSYAKIGSSRVPGRDQKSSIR